MQTVGGSIGAAEKTGWVRKQGGRVRTWKRRHLVLKDNCLYYFKKAEVKRRWMNGTKEE